MKGAGVVIERPTIAGSELMEDNGTRRLAIYQPLVVRIPAWPVIRVITIRHLS